MTARCKRYDQRGIGPNQSFWRRPGLGTLTFYQAMFVRALLRCAAYEIIAWYSCVRSSVRSLINLFRPGVQSILLLSFRHVTILTGSLKIGELPTNRYRVFAVGKRGHAVRICLCSTV